MIIKEFKENSPFVKSNFQNVNNIIDRAKEALGVTFDSDFARKIGILPSTLTNWRKRGTINYPLLIYKCQDISLDWLITGQGERRPATRNNPASSAEQAENSQIASMENQIRELYKIYHEKLEQKPSSEELVEIPLFMHLLPDASYNDPERVGSSVIVSKEFIRDKKNTFAIRLHDDRMIGEGLMQNDLLIVDTALPVKDNCLAIVIHDGFPSVKKIYLREKQLYIESVENQDKLKPVSLGDEFRVLGIVQKVIRELY
jgi:SOS-response transcriptional repressor LexA